MRTLDPGAAVACLALTAYAMVAASLGRLEWLDARVATTFEVLRGCEGLQLVRTLSDASPWISAGLITLSVLFAWRRGLGLRGIAVPLVLLGIGLLEVQALKVLCERDRPGIPPWQVSSGHSFPSGHVANAALCAVTAAILLCRSTRARGRWIATAALAAVWVLVVAATRLYLGRHWATDVTGAALLGVAFAGVATARPLGAPVLAGTAVALQLLGIFLAVEAGGRIHLPAPTALAERQERRAPLRGRRLARVVDGVPSAPKDERRGGRYVLIRDGEARIAVPEGLTERAVLKLVAYPMSAAPGSRCGWIEVAVDGAPIARRALKRRWRAPAFALPALPAGPRVVELQFDPKMVQLRALSLETTAGVLALAPLREAGDGALVRTEPPPPPFVR